MIRIYVLTILALTTFIKTAAFVPTLSSDNDCANDATLHVRTGVCRCDEDSFFGPKCSVYGDDKYA